MLDWIMVKPGDREKVTSIFATIIFGVISVAVPIALFQFLYKVGNMTMCSETVLCRSESVKREARLDSNTAIDFNSGNYKTRFTFYVDELYGYCDYEFTSQNLGKVTAEISKLHSAKDIRLEGILTTCEDHHDTFKPEKAHVDGIEYKCKQR